MKNEALDKENIKENDNKFKYKISLIILALALIFVGVFATYAFFQTPGENNQNTSLNVKAGSMELIFSDGNNGFSQALNFGESASKTFTIKNNGTADAIAKINWKNLTNTYLEGSLTYSLSYYENEGDEPVEIITNKNVPRSEDPITIELANGLEIPVGKTYVFTLTIKLNDLPIDQTSDLNATLRTEFSIEEGTTKKPIIETGNATEVLFSRMNDESIIDYNSGNKSEMYTFTHPEATQTTGWTESERTDYRYIGNTPNNYIQFNDETWRIIGVFTVEGENGVKEQRIKIIRNESLGDFPWDMKSNYNSYTEALNEWPTSSLATMLNGDYVNLGGSFTYTWYTSSGTATNSTVQGLNSTAKNQISQTKWYLGGNSTWTNLGGPDYYNFERGTKVYTGRSTSTIAKVGLMYPSDYIYTYSNGVDNTCYTDGFNCKTSGGGTPSSGWLFDSAYQWTIAPRSSNSNSAFRLYSTGSVYGDVYVYFIPASRPVVYLRSDIEITSGSGTSVDPYTLKN